MTKKSKIYTEEELHPRSNKHIHTNNCLTALLNWFLKIFNLKKGQRESGTNWREYCNNKVIIKIQNTYRYEII